MIDPDVIGECGDQLVEALVEAVAGYGPQADVTALVLVARVRTTEQRGQTLVRSHIAQHEDLDDDTRHAYLIRALETALDVTRHKPLALVDLPSLAVDLADNEDA